MVWEDSDSLKKLMEDPAILMKMGKATARELGWTPGWQYRLSYDDISEYVPSEWRVRFQADHPQYDTLMALAHLMVGTESPHFQLNSKAENGKHLQHAVALLPNDAAIQFAYGNWLQSQRSHEEAVKAYQKAMLLSAPGSEMFKSAKQGEAVAQAWIRNREQHRKAAEAKGGKP